MLLFQQEVIMNTLLTQINDLFADVALAEAGGMPKTPQAGQTKYHETLEENLIEVAFAEAADFDDIHEAILMQHLDIRDFLHPDDCQYGDNDICVV